MPVPSITVSALDIQNEFGGSNPMSIDEYYRGSGTGYVPSGVSHTSSIPLSGVISYQNFRNTFKNTTSITLGYGGGANTDYYYNFVPPFPANYRINGYVVGAGGGGGGPDYGTGEGAFGGAGRSVYFTGILTVNTVTTFSLRFMPATGGGAGFYANTGGNGAGGWGYVYGGIGGTSGNFGNSGGGGGGGGASGFLIDNNIICVAAGGGGGGGQGRFSILPDGNLGTGNTGYGGGYLSTNINDVLVVKFGAANFAYFWGDGTSSSHIPYPRVSTTQGQGYTTLQNFYPPGTDAVSGYDGGGSGGGGGGSGIPGGLIASSNLVYKWTYFTPTDKNGIPTGSSYWIPPNEFAGGGGSVGYSYFGFNVVGLGNGNSWSGYTASGGLYNDYTLNSVYGVRGERNSSGGNGAIWVKITNNTFDTSVS